jgi:hypothetical protein
VVARSKAAFDRRGDSDRRADAREGREGDRRLIDATLNTGAVPVMRCEPIGW